VPGRPDIFVITDQGVDSIRIIKGIKAVTHLFMVEETGHLVSKSS
jgi:hypothetical protein